MMDWRYGEIPPTQEQVDRMAQAHAELEDWLHDHMSRWAYFWKRRIGHR